MWSSTIGSRGWCTSSSETEIGYRSYTAYRTYSLFNNRVAPRISGKQSQNQSGLLELQVLALTFRFFLVGFTGWNDRGAFI